MATPDQRAQFQLDNWQHALAVSQQTGIDPRIVMAQAAVESDWGSKAPGNNLFGIKGPGQVLPTTEAGPDGRLVPTTASFSIYPDQATSFSHYATLPIVQKAGRAGNYAAQIAALRGYATDPSYTNKIDQTAQALNIPAGVRASTLPLYNQAINGPGPGGNAQVVPTELSDPRTAGDADLAGYNSAPNQPQPAPDDKASLLASLAQQRLLNSAMGQSQGLLAQANTPAPPPMAIPLLQIQRGQQIPMPDVATPRRGLLG